MELKSLTNEELRQLEKIYFVLDKKFKGSTVEEKDAFIGEYLQRVERILQSNRNEPTIKQNNYIKSIEAQTGDKFTGRTKFEASEFISFWDYYIRWNDYYNDNLSPDDYINQKKEEYLKKSSYASTTINTKRVKEESLEDRARKGDPQAQHNLGMKLYINGNIEAAEKWYRKAAEQGLSEAQYSLADLCEKIKKDKKEALVWYRKAAEQGEAEAQCRIAMFYEIGDKDLDLPINLHEAFKLYKLAAEQGVAAAQCSLGIFYEEGILDSQDYTEAAKWFEAAANQRNLEAELRLGRMLKEGRGVEKDLMKARKLFADAVLQGDIDAKAELKSIELELL